MTIIAFGSTASLGATTEKAKDHYGGYLQPSMETPGVITEIILGHAQGLLANEAMAIPNSCFAVLKFATDIPAMLRPFDHGAITGCAEQNKSSNITSAWKKQTGKLFIGKGFNLRC